MIFSPFSLFSPLFLPPLKNIYFIIQTFWRGETEKGEKATTYKRVPFKYSPPHPQ